jgi:pimeloyl-ACP methyl ester carboxylesterase
MSDFHMKDLSRRDFFLASASAGSLVLSAGCSSPAEASPVSADAASGDVILPPATEDITPFEIRVPQRALDDLKRRLDGTRWPEHETAAGWQQGVPLRKARELVDHWRTRYDWRRAERAINAFPQYRTKLDGLGIHFIHVRSKHPDALPIVLTHGWPGSLFEFLRVIEPLADPTAHGGSERDAFHVVVPSLPGFGFSDKPETSGWNVPRIARAWTQLMEKLGYERWVSQGGDWGAVVTTALGQQKPKGLAGVHLTWPFVFPATIPTSGLSPDEQRAVEGANAFLNDGSGYFRQQATRPQTIGYALADSPAGQASWIYEKFQAWTDSQGDPETVLSKDAMLDDITLYWLMNTAASSARIYWENAGGTFSQGKIDIPVAASIFPHDIFRAPRSWAEQTYSQLIYWNEVEKGGHFASFEQPEIFVRELRAALPLATLILLRE